MKHTARSTPAHAALMPLLVNTRLKIAAAWTSMLFVFAYVDLFGLYRPDIRADLTQGRLGGAQVTDSFLLATTVFIAVPAMLVLGTLVLRPVVSRITNIIVGLLYAVTTIAGAIGERPYYVLGSAAELMLLAAIVVLAWRWPRAPSPAREPS